MSRYSRPETADRATVNTKSIVSPDNNFVSKEAKDTMKENFQTNKKSVEESKPKNVEVSSSDQTEFEYSPHIDYAYQDPNSDVYEIEESNIEENTEIISVNSTQESGIINEDNIYDEPITPIEPEEEVKSTDKMNYVVLENKSDTKNTKKSPEKKSSDVGNNYNSVKYTPKKGELYIIQYPFNRPLKSSMKKTQIMLHHTVSKPGGGKKVIDEWNNREGQNVATHFVLDTDGVVYQTFEMEGYYAYHVGINHPNNFKLTQTAIGIEIVNWGGLTNKVGSVVNAYGQTVGSYNSPDIISFKDGYRGYYFFQKYTNAQIDALRLLLLKISDKFNIPLDYQSDMWDVSSNALGLKPGIWSHTSVKAEKSDIFPQPEMIGMLKSLKNG